jgi:hypothetical protein
MPCRELITAPEQEETAVAEPGANLQTFGMNHRWDRNFFLAALSIIWIAMIAGFGSDIVRNYPKVGLRYPLIVHVHAAVFVSWLALFTTQILLIRRNAQRLHRKLGMLALMVIPPMIVLGPMTAIMGDASHFGHPETRFPFLSIQFSNVLASSTLLIAGILARKHPAAHKRLMLMGTLAITEPGFSRFLFDPIAAFLGKGEDFWLSSGSEGFWPFLIADFGPTIVLLVGVGAYDLVTRRRLYPVYLPALVWVLANEGVATWLYGQPWWAELTTHLIGK